MSRKTKRPYILMNTMSKLPVSKDGVILRFKTVNMARLHRKNKCIFLGVNVGWMMEIRKIV